MNTVANSAVNRKQLEISPHGDTLDQKGLIVRYGTMSIAQSSEVKPMQTFTDFHYVCALVKICLLLLCLFFKTAEFLCEVLFVSFFY